MNKNKLTGWLLLLGAFGAFIPYTILTTTFEYPQILRQDVFTILTKFNAGGSGLIFTWFTFAIMGLPLLLAYVMIGQKLENKSSWIKFATLSGIISIIAQMIGLLRWVFVVPVLGKNMAAATADAARESIRISFELIHQFAGVLIGEHIGQLFTIIWTIIICLVIYKTKLFPSWIAWFGIISSIIYFFAQAELFATVINSFPVWELAGFIGSTLWLIWLIILGIRFIKLDRTAGLK
ncbi:MAG: DUF4386 domain-containing protein [Ignavibacteria bacterium]|nr:DUF4386 domain-containing protein [Ignavibacteria bacterium]